MDVELREPSVEDEGNDSPIEESEEDGELEESVEDEEEVEVSSEDIPSLLLDFSTKKKVNVKLPSPVDPKNA